MDLPTPEPPRLLSLTGYRGTGKTTVGKTLAQLVGYDFLDTDAIVQEMDGREISAIFAAEGESAFRDLETAAIESVVRRDQVIVALGGGAILREENRQRLQHAGPIVWLTASPDTIRARISVDSSTATQRPNLTAQGALSEIEQVLRERSSIYAAAADLEIDTERATPGEIARRIQNHFFCGR